MTRRGAALVDTSVHIGREQGRPLLAEAPSPTAVSVVTVGELRAGVLVTDDPTSRVIRQETLLDAPGLEVLRL